MRDPATALEKNMRAFEREVAEELATIKAQGLYRQLRRVASAQSPCIEIEGQKLLNFSSNDYLGLANSPELKLAAIEAIEHFGAGAGASRLICGSLAPHHALEETLAVFKGAEAALCFSTGYAAALGTLCALVGKDDVIVLDRLVHASIVDAARLSGARLRVFAHNDLNHLEAILKWAEEKTRGPQKRRLVVTESVFSMDGDRAPLCQMVELKERYGAWLMVDEAHATGLYGAHGRGLAEELGVSDAIEVQMGTLGKALGASGGYISGPRALIDLLINRARSFIFSTAPVPAAAAAATAGVRFVQSSAGRQRCALLWQRVAELDSKLRNQDPRTTGGSANRTQNSKLKTQKPSLPTPILPLRIGDEVQAVEAAAALRRRGIFIPAIRYPAVARGQARLRLTVTAAHTEAGIAELLAALKNLDFGL